MAKLTIKNDNIVVQVPKNTSMRKVATKTGSSMHFGCRVGDCGTCIATIDSGMEYLSAKSDKEIKMMEILGVHEENQRLLCQVDVISDEGEVVLWF